jgi:hypothetical protein
MQPLTFEQLNALPTTTDLITAARALRIGRTKAYGLAKAGEFPVRIIRVGTSYHVPTSELLKVPGVTPLKEAPAQRRVAVMDFGSRTPGGRSMRSLFQN